MMNYDLQPEELLFFGDSIADLSASKENNVPFIIRKHKHNSHLSKNYKGQSIIDFLNITGSLVE